MAATYTPEDMGRMIPTLERMAEVKTEGMGALEGFMAQMVVIYDELIEAEIQRGGVAALRAAGFTRTAAYIH